jgi:hypothetical protein
MDSNSTPANVGSNDGLGAWVPMAERWPPPDAWLLVTWGGSVVDKAHTFTKWKHRTNPKGYLIQGHPGSHNCVTHWMLLPAPAISA